MSAVSVALAEPVLPGEECGTLPDHLEDIVTGSHPSLGEAGQLLLRNLLHRYAHVFPAPGEPVTGHTTSAQHEILTSELDRTCIKEMLLGGQIEPSDRSMGVPCGPSYEKGWIHALLC